MALADLLRGRTVYLDANVFIYTTEGLPAYAKPLTAISEMMEVGELKAVTSELTLAEVLTKPIADGDDELVKTYKETVETSEGLLVVPVSRAVLIAAAGVRATHDTIRLADAVHIATAQAAGCHSVVTNDKSWKKLPDLEVILLADLVEQ